MSLKSLNHYEMLEYLSFLKDKVGNNTTLPNFEDNILFITLEYENHIIQTQTQYNKTWEVNKSYHLNKNVSVTYKYKYSTTYSRETARKELREEFKIYYRDKKINNLLC